MSSSYTSNLKIELIATGDQVGTWGVTTNDNFQYVFEEAIVGRGNPDFAADADLTLTLVNSVGNQTARNVYLNVTSSVGGGLTAPRNLIVPTINKNYVVENNTTGGQDITIKTAAGTGILVPNGRRVPVYVNGTNVVAGWDYVAEGVSMAVGTTAQRPSPAKQGYTRFNTDLLQYEGYNGTAWGQLGGGASGGPGNPFVYENAQNVTTNYTITAGKNGMTAGPLTINSGVTVTVPSGSSWIVL